MAVPNSQCAGLQLYERCAAVVCCRHALASGMYSVSVSDLLVQ